jgi:hypothetical protein
VKATPGERAADEALALCRDIAVKLGVDPKPEPES